MLDSARSWLLRHPKGPGGDTNYISKICRWYASKLWGKAEGKGIRELHGSELSVVLIMDEDEGCRYWKLEALSRFKR